MVLGHVFLTAKSLISVGVIRRNVSSSVNKKQQTVKPNLEARISIPTVGKSFSNF